MAHALLSAVYANTGQSALAPAFSRQGVRAARPRQRARAVLHLLALLPRRVQAWDKALELARSWTATYPREAFAFNSLGVALHPPRTVRAVGRAVPRGDPARSAVHSRRTRNLAASLLALNRLRRGAGHAAAGRRSQARLHRRAAGCRISLAFVQGDARDDGARAGGVDRLRETNAAFGWQAHTSAFGGRVHDGARAVPPRHPAGAPGRLQGSRGAADAWKTPRCTRSSDSAPRRASEVAAGLAVEPRQRHARARRPRAGAVRRAREAAQLSNELARRLPEATLTMHLSLPVIAAAALFSRATARATVLLEPVRPYDHAPSGEFWPRYLRGLAYLHDKSGQAAADQFRSISVENQGEAPAAALYPPYAPPDLRDRRCRE